MPPKRKASALSNANNLVGAGRTLRSGHTTAATAPKPTATRASRRGRPAKAPTPVTHDVKETIPDNLSTATSASDAAPMSDAAPVRRSRRIGKKVPSPERPVSAVSTSHVQPRKPRAAKRRKLETPQEESEKGDKDEDADDEPPLAPSKKPTARLETPPKKPTPRPAGTPRMVMQCVEIVSPLKRAKAGSPTPRRPRRDTTDVSTTQAGPSSSSPDRRSTRAGTSILAATSATSPSPDRNSSDVDAPNRLISPPASPGPLQFPLTPAASPSKRKPAPQVSPSRRTQTLHPDLHLALHAQQRAILRSLRDVPQIDEIELAVEEEDGGPSTNAVAYEQLSDLLTGTVMRGEGNSCLLIGPRGSSKTRLVEQAISTLPEQPITIRLSGYAQQNDRLAIREIARQLTLQTGSSFLPLEDDKADGVQEDAENPFLDAPDASVSIALPAPSHLLALISMIPTLPRATVIVLDAFDQFAMHARQSLLYCLLDTAQSCRVGKGNNGLAVIGVTTRVDTINLLEKRVKSRFSGRMLRTACPGQVQYWQALTRAVFTASRNDQPDDEFDALWNASVDEFLANDTVDEAFRETYALTRDVHTLRRILTSVVLELSPAHPFPSPSTFASAARTQRCPPRFAFLSTLPYPAICLLIAAMHAQTSGHDAFTFEMLHEAFRDQVRTSQSAPVQVDGGGIGMVRCTREVLIGAFERLVSLRVFVTTVPPSTSTAREFMLHRCAVERADVKAAVDAMGQTNLKKWLNKMQ